MEKHKAETESIVMTSKGEYAMLSQNLRLMLKLKLFVRIW